MAKWKPIDLETLEKRIYPVLLFICSNVPLLKADFGRYLADDLKESHEDRQGLVRPPGNEHSLHDGKHAQHQEREEYPEPDEALEDEQDGLVGGDAATLWGLRTDGIVLVLRQKVHTMLTCHLALKGWGGGALDHG